MSKEEKNFLKGLSKDALVEIILKEKHNFKKPLKDHIEGCLSLSKIGSFIDQQEKNKIELFSSVTRSKNNDINKNILQECDFDIDKGIDLYYKKFGEYIKEKFERRKYFSWLIKSEKSEGSKKSIIQTSKKLKECKKIYDDDNVITYDKTKGRGILDDIKKAACSVALNGKALSLFISGHGGIKRDFDETIIEIQDGEDVDTLRLHLDIIKTILDVFDERKCTEVPVFIFCDCCRTFENNKNAQNVPKFELEEFSQVKNRMAMNAGFLVLNSTSIGTFATFEKNRESTIFFEAVNQYILQNETIDRIARNIINHTRVLNKAFGEIGKTSNTPCCFSTLKKDAYIKKVTFFETMIDILYNRIMPEKFNFPEIAKKNLPIDQCNYRCTLCTNPCQFKSTGGKFINGRCHGKYDRHECECHRGENEKFHDLMFNEKFQTIIGEFTRMTLARNPKELAFFYSIFVGFLSNLFVAQKCDKIDEKSLNENKILGKVITSFFNAQENYKDKEFKSKEFMRLIMSALSESGGEGNKLLYNLFKNSKFYNLVNSQGFLGKESFSNDFDKKLVPEIGTILGITKKINDSPTGKIILQTASKWASKRNELTYSEGKFKINVRNAPREKNGIWRNFEIADVKCLVCGENGRGKIDESEKNARLRSIREGKAELYEKCMHSQKCTRLAKFGKI